MSDDPIALRVLITGRVQGVGYRNWTRLRASAAGLAGFVRNRADGSVEAVFAGPRHEVDDMVLRCRVGPRGAEVGDVVAEPWLGPPPPARFALLPTL